MYMQSLCTCHQTILKLASGKCSKKVCSIWNSSLWLGRSQFKLLQTDLVIQKCTLSAYLWLCYMSNILKFNYLWNICSATNWNATFWFKWLGWRDQWNWNTQRNVDPVTATYGWKRTLDHLGHLDHADRLDHPDRPDHLALCNCC